MTWPEQDPARDATTAPGQEPFHLGAFGSAARSAGEPAGTKLAQGEAKAAPEAVSLGTRPRVAAEMVGLLGAESGEAVLKVQGLGHAFKEVQEAYGGFGRAGGNGAGLRPGGRLRLPQGKRV
jgi:hypothetical protein